MVKKDMTTAEILPAQVRTPETRLLSEKAQFEEKMFGCDPFLVFLRAQYNRSTDDPLYGFGCEPFFQSHIADKLPEGEDLAAGIVVYADGEYAKPRAYTFEEYVSGRDDDFTLPLELNVALTKSIGDGTSSKRQHLLEVWTGSWNQFVGATRYIADFKATTLGTFEVYQPQRYLRRVR